jgi:hypothetical protein
MRRPTLCASHKGPPRAAQSSRCMPARRPETKPSRISAPHADLGDPGLRVPFSGPHSSKGLMLQEQETLLAASADAATKAFQTVMVEEYVLGKGTLSARKETASRLNALHRLNPTRPLFRVLRTLWGAATTTRLALTSYSQLVCGCSCVRDFLLKSPVTPTREEEG